MRFVLTIELGNEAMSTQDDIAQAMQRVGAILRTYGRTRTPLIGDSGPIRDSNGNRVGGWHVEGESK